MRSPMRRQGTPLRHSSLHFIPLCRLVIRYEPSLTAISLAFISCFLVVDLAFLAANLLKIVDGGWVPLLLATCAMVVMWTWVRGTELLARKTQRDSISMLRVHIRLNFEHKT